MVNYKKHITIMSVMVVVFALVSVFFYKWAFDDVTNSVNKVYSNTRDNSQVLELKDNDTIEQKIKIKDEVISSMSFMFGTYQQQNNGTLNIEIEDDDGDVYYSGEVNLNQLLDNQNYMFKLNKPIENMENQTITVKMNIKYATSNDKIAIYSGASSADNTDFTLSVNGNIISDKVITVSGYDGVFFSLKIAYVLISIFLTLGFVLLYYLVFVKKAKIENLFLVLFLFISIVYSSIFTPYSTPDEPKHVETAYRYSNVLMFKGYKTEDGNMLIRKSDYEGIKEGGLSVKIDKEVYDYVNNNMFELSDNNELIEVYGYDIDAPFWMYLPQAVGITLGRILNLGTMLTLYLGKLVNILVFAVIAYFSIKRAPICKGAFVTVALFPMTVHLVSSFSSDAVVIAMSFLLVSQCLYLMGREGKITTKDLVKTAVFSFLLGPCKGLAYLPICFLCLIIPKEKFVSRKNQVVFNLVVIFAGVAGIVFESLSRFMSLVTEDGAASNYYPLSYMFENPVDFIRIFINTLDVKTDFYITSIIGSSLSWFSVHISMWIVFLFAILYVLSCMRTSEDKLQISKYRKLWIFVICSGVFVAISVALFIGWTQIGTRTIEGVQGRYFLEAMVLVGLLIHCSSIIIKKDFLNRMCIYIYVLQCLSIMDIVKYNL